MLDSEGMALRKSRHPRLPLPAALLANCMHQLRSIAPQVPIWTRMMEVFFSLYQWKETIICLP